MEKKVQFHEYQLKAYNSEKRFIALIAGTGGGKTFFGPIWLAKEIHKFPDDQFFVIAPTYKILTRATMPMLLECYRGTRLQGEYKESKGQYLLPYGGIIWCGSADRPESLEGVQVQAAWMDEAGQMKYMAWIVIQARVGRKLGRVLITTTPYALNWLYTEFYKPWEEHRFPEAEVVQFESIDSPFYPKEEYDRAKRSMDPRIFDMRYRGLFRKMAGLVYRDFGPNHIIDPLTEKWKDFKLPQGCQRFCGIDFGYHNPFVCVFLAKTKDGVYYLYDEHYQDQMLLKEHVAHIRAKTGTDKINQFYPDPEATQEIEELRALGIGPLEIPNNDVKVGIEKVNELIRNNKFFVFNHCKNTIDEFETYHYSEKKEDQEAKEDPVKFNDHALDAIRYVVMGSEKYFGKGPAVFDNRLRGNYGFKKKT